MVLGLVALSWNSLEVLKASGLGSAQEDLRRGRGILPGNAAYAQGLGREALVRGDAEEASRLAEEAIGIFPYRGSAWLDLAEARLKLGDREGVLRAAQKASMLGPTKGKWRWRAARVLLQAGWTDRATAELAAVARVDPSRRHDAYDLAWTVFGDSGLLLDRIVPTEDSARIDYLHYLIDRQRLEPAVDAWKIAKRAATRQQRYSYIDFLLAHGAVGEAWRAWREAFPEARIGAVYDGAFLREVTGHGFGWRLGETENALARIARPAGAGEPALEVDFTGGNPEFDHSNQIVRVAEGVGYRLAARVRWQEVTSASLPHLYVRGYAGCGLELESDGFKGSGEGLVVLEFETPPGCQAVLIGLQRRSTRKLDRNITGKVWISRIELSARGGAEVEARSTSGGSAPLVGCRVSATCLPVRGTGAPVPAVDGMRHRMTRAGEGV